LYAESGGGGVGGGFAQTYEGEPIWSLESSSIFFQVAFRTVGTNGEERASPPTVNVTVTTETGGLRADRFDTGTLSEEFVISDGFFKVANGKIVSRMLDANAIDMGSVAGVPARFRIFGPLGVLWGYMGQDTNRLIPGHSGPFYDGAWFKNLRAGGAFPSSARLVCNDSGDLAIIDGTFTLSLGGTTTTIANLLESQGIVGVRVKENANSRASWLLPGRTMYWTTSGVIGADVNVAAGYGFLSLSNTGGSARIVLDGSTGAAEVRTLVVGESANTGSLTWKGPTASVAYAGVQSIPSLCDGFIRVTIDGVGVRRIPYFLDTGGL
jgi:hypothetical protein